MVEHFHPLDSLGIRSDPDESVGHPSAFLDPVARQPRGDCAGG